MKAEIPLQWHMHVGKFMIYKSEDSWGERVYVAQDEYDYEDEFRTLKEAVEWAKAED